MVSDLEHMEKRQSRIEDAIDKLTEISADLNKMLAVQEQRLSQQERSMGIIEDMVERRREEYENKIQNVYNRCILFDGRSGHHAAQTFGSKNKKRLTKDYLNRIQHYCDQR